MSQELHVLQCYSCETYQVHIVKKSNKWECKVCGEKQSIKKVFGRGSGKDCRAHVQRLNDEKRKKEMSFLNKRLDLQCIENVVDTETHIPSLRESKWQKYLSEEEEDFSDDSLSVAAQFKVEENSDDLKDSRIKDNYSVGSTFNPVVEKKLDPLPKPHMRERTYFNNALQTKSEGTNIHTIENTYVKFLGTPEETSLLAKGFHDFNDSKLSKTSSTKFTQKQSNQLCFSLLPGGSVQDDFLECFTQEKIHSDLNDSTNEMYSPVQTIERFNDKEIEKSVPLFSENDCTNYEVCVRFQSNIQSSYENTSIIKPMNCSSKANNIFHEEYSEDELDKILNL